ncbi:outer membrane protein assembly factor BamD [Oligoflexia bacterium]|nr:outer membrane protein assembly factor BamD [Oligoflexia bacterium]
MLKRRFRIYSLALLTCAIWGCSSSEDAEPEIAEISTTEAPIVDASQLELFESAKKSFGLGLYLVARDGFQSLSAGYPLGPYTEFAEIKIADSYFELREYGEAAPLYEELLKNRPASHAAPYLTFRAARSYQLSSKGAGRDVAPLAKAVEYYNKVLSDFSGSMYMQGAKTHLKLAQKEINEHDEIVALFYKKRNKVKAFEARQKELEEQMALLDTVDKDLPEPTEVAGAALADAPTNAGVPPQPNILSSLRHTQSIEELPRMTDQRATTALRGQPGSRTAPATSPDTSFTDPNLLQVQQIKCVAEEDKFVQIFLNKAIADQDFLTRFSSISSENGKLTLILPRKLHNDASFDCFQEKDLVVAKNGTITITSDLNAELVTINHPPRLLLRLYQ